MYDPDVMFSLACDLQTCVAFTSPLSWPHGMVKCPLGAHFRFSAEVIGHLFA